MSKLNPVGLTLKEYKEKSKSANAELVGNASRDTVTGVRINGIIFNFKKVKKNDKFLKDLGSCIISEGADASYFLNQSSRQSLGEIAI